MSRIVNMLWIYKTWWKENLRRFTPAIISALKEGRPQARIVVDEQISRQTARRWQARSKEHGEDWPTDRVPRRRPAMSN